MNDMNRKLWGDLYSRKNPIGDHNIILTATKEKMQVIQKKYYYPNNSILILAGDVEHAEAFQKAEEIFGDWTPSDFDPFVKYPIPEFKLLQKSELYFTENANARNPIIAMGYHGPDTRNDLKATYAADVFSFIMGQKSSKLQQDLIDSGLAFDIGVNYQTCKYTGPILVFAVPHPEKVKEVRDKLEEHIAQWDSDNYFTDEQLETAKTLITIDDAHGRERRDLRHERFHQLQRLRHGIGAPGPEQVLEEADAVRRIEIGKDQELDRKRDRRDERQDHRQRHRPPPIKQSYARRISRATRAARPTVS